MDSAVLTEITTYDELREVVPPPLQQTADKARQELHDLDRQWLAASPFCLIATSAADGSCDVSPKGDPAGFTKVLDNTTIVIPERPGNRRVDGFVNILSNPHVGLIYLIPGRNETLRINGRAKLLKDAPFFDEMVVKGHRPRMALLVEIEEIFHHCAKAFLRSSLWKTESWEPDAVPSRAKIAKALDRQDDDLAQLEQYYGPSYEKSIYATND